MSFIRFNLFGSREKKPAAKSTHNNWSIALKFLSFLNLASTAFADNCQYIIKIDGITGEDPLARFHQGLETTVKHGSTVYKYFANLAHMSPTALIEQCKGTIESQVSVAATKMAPSDGAWTLLHTGYNYEMYDKKGTTYPVDAFYRAVGDAAYESFECCVASIGNVLDSNTVILIASIAGCLLLMKLANQQNDECKKDESRKLTIR